MTEPVFPTKLRFRPECEHDAGVLLDAYGADKDRFTKFNPEPAPGVPAFMHSIGGIIWEVEVPDAIALGQLVERMAQVPDGHRMLQTLDTVDSFTGEAYEGDIERTGRIIPMIEANSDADGIVQAYLDGSGLRTSETVPRI